MKKLRRPVAGDYVMIVMNVRTGGLRRAYVCETKEEVGIMSNRVGLTWITASSLLESERGILWALGIEGPEVEALRVVTALL